MATINASSSADIIVPSNNGDTYRGLGGDDTYIISNAVNGDVTIVDTVGTNTIQLVDGLSISSTKFAADSVKLTLSNGSTVTVNGADNFTFEIGGNETSATTGSSVDYAGLASAMGVASLPTGSTISDGTGGTISGTSVGASATYTLSASANTVAEGGSITYTVTASSAPSSDVTLTYSVVGNDLDGAATAAGSSDLVSLSGTVTIASGSTSATFDVTANTDESNEGLEGIKVSLLDSSNSVVGSHTASISNTTSTAATTTNLTTGVDTVAAGDGDNIIGGTITAANAIGSTAQPGDVIDGGAGQDTFKLSLAGTLTGDHTISGLELTNVEEIQINGFQTADARDYTLDMTLMSDVDTIGLTSSSADNDITINNVPSLMTVNAKQGGGDLTVTYLATVVAGAADAQTLNVNNYTGTVSLAGVEAMTIDSSGTKSTLAALTATSMKSLTVTGDALLTITGVLEDGMTSVDASGSTGGVRLTLTPTAATGVSVTGSDAADIYTLGASLSLLTPIDGNGGADTVSISDGATLTSLTGAVLSDIEVLSASATDTDQYNTSFVPGITAVASSAASDADTTTQVTFSYMDAENSTATISGTEDVTLTLAVDGAADVGNITVGLATQASLTNVDVLANDYETINLTGGVLTTTGITMTLFGGSDLTTLNVSGGKVTVSGWNGGTLLTTVDATGVAAFVMPSSPASTYADTVTGSAGNDTLYGGTKVSTVSGGAGNDTLYGGASGDTLTGGAGNDILWGQAGTDTINGGAGNDIIQVDVAANFEDLASPDVIDGGDGTDVLNFGAAVNWTVAAEDLNIVNVERITFDSTGNASITVNDDVYTTAGATSMDIRDTEGTGTFDVVASSLSAANSITVTTSAAAIVDTITGGAGDDTLKVTTSVAGAWAATDTFTGGKGTDEMIITVGAAALTQATQTGVTAVEKITFIGTTATASNWTLADATFVTTSLATVSGVVDASAMTGSGVLTFVGSAEDDSAMTLTGGRGNDILTGTSTTTAGDTISGGPGNDTLDGDAGIDNISGGEGNDIIAVNINGDFIGLTSAETVDGGSGTDTLYFNDDTSSVTIAAADLANMSGIEIISLAGNDATSITLSDSVFTANGSSTLRITRDDDTAVNFTVAAGGLSAANSLDVRPADGGSATDIITLGAGDDSVIYLDGAHFDTADTINGGLGTDGIIVYQAGNNHSATYTNVSNIESITYSNLNGGTVGGTLADGNFVSQTLATVSGVGLTTALTFDGTAENDSSIALTGGTAGDTLTGTDTTTKGDTIKGNGGADTIDGSKGGDTLTGGAGADIFTYNAIADSNTGAKDSITDFLSGTDGLAVTLDYSTSTQDLTITGDVTTAKTSKSAVQDSFTGVRGQAVYSTDDEALYINYNNDNIVTSLDYAIDINPGATATTTVADADITWTIKGGSGADIITGNVNADTIEPGSGIDVINSGRGADILTLTVDGADDVIRLQTNELYTDGTSVDNGSVGVDVITSFLQGASGDQVEISLAAIEAMSGVIDLVDSGNAANSTAAGDTMVVTDYGTAIADLSDTATTTIIPIIQSVANLAESALEDLFETGGTNQLEASGALAVGDAFLIAADDDTDSALYLAVVQTAIADNGKPAANGINLVKLLTFDGTSAAQSFHADNFEIIA